MSVQNIRNSHRRRLPIAAEKDGKRIEKPHDIEQIARLKFIRAINQLYSRGLGQFMLSFLPIDAKVRGLHFLQR